MVLASVIRRTAAKRIPLIKFRRQREEEMAASRSGSLNSGASQGKSSSPAAVCISFDTKHVKQTITNDSTLSLNDILQAISLPTIEDWQLPNRYRRKPLDTFEIEYINRGGPA